MKSRGFRGECAKRWEAVQKLGKPKPDDKDSDFAPVLFHYYLWRARNWRGQKIIEWESHDDVIDTFQDRSLPSDVVDEVPLYPGAAGCQPASLRLSHRGRYEAQSSGLKLSQDVAHLPFSIRQPIHRGLGFFLYTEKYARMHNWLFHNADSAPELEAFRGFYNKVVCSNSHYLRELFELVALMYTDRFGSDGLFGFALWMDHVLGAIRLKNVYVFKEAAPKYLREAGHNVLDVIAAAYRPEEVVDFLKSEKRPDTVYTTDWLENRPKVVCGEGVRGRYLEAVLAYYVKKQIDGKAQWIGERLRNG